MITSPPASVAHAVGLAFGDHDGGVVQESVEQADGGGVLGQEAAPRRHPWAIRLTPVAGAVQAIALFENVEWMMRVLAAQGLTPDEAMAIITFAAAYTSGMALQGTRAVVEDHEVGLDVEHWWKAREQESLRIAQQGQYPLTFSISGPPDVNTLFRLGLKHLLDGLTSLIESKRDRSRRTH